MIVAFFGAIAMAMILMYQPFVEPVGSDDWHDPNVVSGMAQHFIVYKNVVSDHLYEHPAAAYEQIMDSSLVVPPDWKFPEFHHKAQKDSNGWAYVWSETPGSFYINVYEGSHYSAAVCRVVATRQCVRADSATATLPASLVPSYITTGSTVYAWRP